MIDPAYPQLSRALADSLLWRAGAWTFDALAAAWPLSVAGRFSQWIREVRDLSSLASIAALGGILCLLIQPMVPQYVRPGLPWMWPLAVIAIAVIVAVNGRAFERAWPHSRVAWLFTRRQDR